ncbi:MAG TPA: hypothetical protein VHN99_02720 [Deinococcales bacterium]|nr:hypothetical protein [Deinococcales bacterium]
MLDELLTAVLRSGNLRPVLIDVPAGNDLPDHWTASRPDKGVVRVLPYLSPAGVTCLRFVLPEPPGVWNQPRPAAPPRVVRVVPAHERPGTA